MKTLNKYELAWAAGFFDGEGYVAATKRKGKKSELVNIGLSIAQVHPEVLERFRDAVQYGKVTGPHERKKANTQPVYSYAVRGPQPVQYIVAVLWNYLSPVKKAQAKNALLSYKNRPVLKPGPVKKAGISVK